MVEISDCRLGIYSWWALRPEEIVRSLTVTTALDICTVIIYFNASLVRSLMSVLTSIVIRERLVLRSTVYVVKVFVYLVI